MQSTRRDAMLSLSGALATMLTARVLCSPAAGQTHAPIPRPMPSPNAPTNTNAPVQLGQQDIPVRGPGGSMPPATWKEIKTDAQKLYEMAAGFATRVDNTNVADTLPVSLLKEAHAIEKLAKHIQSRMKG